MKKMTNATVSLFILFLFASCAKPMISNLERGTYAYGNTNDDVLNVSVGVLPVSSAKQEEEKPKTFFDLRDSLPHLYLKILSSKITNPDSLIKYLAKPLSEIPKKDPEKKPTDFTLHKVRFSFANLKKYYNDEKYMHPNTRLEYLTTSLVITDSISPVTFYTIDRLENEYDEIDLGMLTRDQTVTLNAKITGETGFGSSVTNTSSDKRTGTSGNQSLAKQNIYDSKGNVIGTIDNTLSSGSGSERNSGNTQTSQASTKANAELGYLNSESIKEAVAVKLKRLRTGFVFSDRTLTIAQRGRPLGDISDNIYVTATLKVSSVNNVFSLNVFDFDKLFGEDGNPVKADNLSFSSRLVKFVPCDNARDIQLTTNYEGAVRVPGNESKKAGENALEYDDKVTFYKFGNKGGGSLHIDKNVYCKNAYKITATNAKKDEFVLKIAAPLDLELDVFSDDRPELLLEWVRRQQADPSAEKLVSGKFKMYFENIATKTRIYLVNDKLDDDAIKAIKTLINITNIARNR